MDDIDTRIRRLLDQLETPHLQDVEIERIKQKIAYLESLKKT